MMRFLLWFVVVAVTWGQQQFEIASIRPSPLEGGGQCTISPTPAGFSATTMSLRFLIFWAYRLNDTS